MLLYRWKWADFSPAITRAASPNFVTREKAVNGPNVKDLHAKIGQLAMENNFLARALGRIDGAKAER
jgi:hypothetical protein